MTPARGSTARFFRSAAARAKAWDAYDRRVAATDGIVSAQRVPTRFGETQVLAAGDADLPPLIFLHGWGGNATDWIPQLVAFSDRFRVHAPDVIGHPGKSAEVRLDARGQDYGHWLSDVLAALGVGRAAFVGISGGAWFILRLAAVAPDRISAAVMLSPAGFTEVRPRSLRALLLMLPFVLWPDQGRARGFVRLITAPGTAVPESESGSFATRFATFHMGDLGSPPRVDDADLMRLSAPTIVLVGAHEVFSDPKAVVARARMLPDLRAGEILPAAGHAMTLDLGTALDERIRAFLLATAR
jgi:pimeloyl-ACP methyl ester carboxylesterase